MTALTALSPLDGRYQDKVSALQASLSEYGLIRYRILVEIHWLLALSQEKSLADIPKLNQANRQKLMRISENFTLTDAETIKNIEKTTNHDVKAVEYYLQQQCNKDDELRALIPFIHFACTSEDINNLAYALMIKNTMETVILPVLRTLGMSLQKIAVTYADLPLLSRTHGQPATPSTVGKEFANFVARIHQQYRTLKQLQLPGKINGAVGNFNAHHTAYPDFDWITFSDRFIESLGLIPNHYTTQIEPHDCLIALLQNLMRINVILIDFCRDIWGYISLGYLQQEKIATEIGSSTMPHKVNPIDFENAEGNLGLANALITHLSHKLPISRWQRDLTDSTVMRNLGTVFGYALLAYQSLAKGISKIKPDLEKLNQDLDNHWEILAEALQTTMRRYGIPDAYEQLKKITRGQSINQKDSSLFIKQLSLPETVKQHLLTLTPQNYLGYAKRLAENIQTLTWN